MNEQPVRPIFFDPSERRASRVQTGAVVFALTMLILTTLFCASVLIVPMAARLRLAPPRFLPDVMKRGQEFLHAREPVAKVAPKSPVTPPQPTTTGAVPGRANGVVGGFYVAWDSSSIASLRLHADKMTHLFPAWLQLSPAGDGLVINDNDPSDREARKLCAANGVKIVPLINNFASDRNDFDEARLHALLTTPRKRQALAQRLFGYVRRNGYAGVNIDFETEDSDDRDNLALFAAEVSSLFHPHGLLTTVCTQVDGDNAQTAAIARGCDFIVPMVYDLHWSGGGAGAIAPRAWAEENIRATLAHVPADKIVLAVGNYAYDWIRGTHGAKTLTFGEAMVTAQESLDAETPVSTEGRVQWDTKTQNPYFTYEEEGKTHEVWAMDAATAFNTQRFAEANGISGRVLWYVGSEDPSLWSFFGKNNKATRTTTLSTVRYGFELAFEGEGEALDVATLPQVGSRTLTTNANGYISGEAFTKYPTACIVRRSGKRAKQVAFTFDDGPDPRWTPAVLDALGKAKVPATFFVIGAHAQQYPELLRREEAGGHLIGNHSFYHPNFALVSAERAALEIDATERAIQAATLHSTTIFRPPYGIDVEPSTVGEVKPLIEAEKRGYITIGEGIDPRDWESGKNKKTAEQIAAGVLRDADADLGNIVLLHDSGGDRAETVRAIPLIAAGLRAHGYKIVGVNVLLGDTPAAIMPAVTGKERYVALFDRAVFAVSSGTGNFFAGVFVVSLLLGTVRMLATAILALRHASNEKRNIAEPMMPTNSPTVSVIIAAYNEEKVIARTINALLAGGYPHLEVIVVDDGSKDDTSGVVKETFAGEPRVRLVAKPNGGKASALNAGIAQAAGKILIGLDADTLFAPDTVARLVRHFADPRVGAVAGNILVGNRNNLLTRWQAVEYTTSQNFDRRAYDTMNAIPVVPGCVGAWRKEAVTQAGGYQTDTLAEDADLTWRVRKNGWRIVCDNTALAFTEAPEKLSELMKQRFRWTFGTLQVLWKHRDTFGNSRYGYFGTVVIPSLWLFQIGLPLAAPVADIGIIATVFSKNAVTVAVYGAFFFASEWAAAYLAFALDGANRERRADLRYLFLQRLAYRYIMYAVLMQSLTAAVRGVRAGWGKLERKGTARVTSAAPGS